MTVALALVGAYLVGAIPVGYLVARALGGLDIRRHGSGNIGTTNVLRTLGRLPAGLTLAGDVATERHRLPARVTAYWRWRAFCSSLPYPNK